MTDDGLGDWRFEAVTTLAKDVPAAYPGGPSHKAGAAVLLTTVTRNLKGELVGFVTPSSVALALNIASASASKAEDIRPTISYITVPGPDGVVHSVPSQYTSALFDLFEQCMISATFSFQALEAFCNHAIGRNIQAPMKVKTRQGEQILSVAELERKLSTEEKVGKILPEIFGVASPRGTAIWERLKQLQKARDSIIHLKTIDQYPMSKIDTQTLFFQMLNHNPFEFPNTAIAIINYFYDGKNRPRWVALARSACPEA